eukprot:Gregarina_sp_Pseudo_9__1419@NODE_194_length_3673_cov_193_555586_g179_i0_p2_GENE_NODE_194_length_3673_cov_193_555586_g179_i0NODE_194_length_3673_cov_193_555586_g179_i0_p2_ORF_typecomplete_len241_score58_09Calxbeta/PF03160_14/1_8e03Calxbeta/PF03160_14/0_43_NODE_194_length_3673_cov_193_555586_g179_i026933415
MKFLTVSGFLCGLLTRAQNVQPELSFTVETAEFTEDIPVECQVAAGLSVSLSELQACFDSIQGYTGTFSYSGFISAGVWAGNPCALDASDNTGAYLSVESLIKYVPDWMLPGELTGTYTLTLGGATTKECTVSFLVPDDQTGTSCVAPIAGTKAGDDITVPSGVTTFTAQAANFADSVKIAAKSADCKVAELGGSLVSIDASNAKYPFLFQSQSTDPTGPNGATHVIIGTLFLIPLMASL